MSNISKKHKHQEVSNLSLIYIVSTLNWLGKADEISVSYCFASNSAAAWSSSSEADSKMEGNRIPKCHGDWIHAKETFLDLGASCIHGSEKCWHENGSRLIWDSLPEKNVWQNVGRRQRWAGVHCTPCIPYCYATGHGPAFCLLWDLAHSLQRIVHWLMDIR